MKCKRCGRENPSNTKRCRYCNTPFYGHYSNINMPNRQKLTNNKKHSKKNNIDNAIIAAIVALAVLLTSVIGVYAYQNYVPKKKGFSSGGGGGGIVSTASKNREIKSFKNGDVVFVPKEENMAYDEDSAVIYYNNLLIVYTLSNLAEDEMSELADLVNGEVVGKFSGGINAIQIRVDVSTLETLNSLAELLMSDSRVMYAGYEYPIQPDNSESDGNPWSEDNNQPDLDRGNEDNPNGNDWWTEAIGMYSAWEYDDNTNAINVGILDSGFQSNHPDLSGSIHWIDSYQSNTPEDHGTHVAGIIGANNNNIGIRGVADNASLYCVDWSPSQGINHLSTGEYIEITKQLIENDVRIVNNSWGNYFMSKEGYTRSINEGGYISYILQYLAVSATGAYDSYVKYIDTHSKRTALDCTLIMIELILNGNDDFLIVQAAGNGYDNAGPGVDARKSCFYSAIDESVYNVLSQTVRDSLRERGVSYDSIADRKVIVGAVLNSRNNNGNYKMTSFSNYGDTVDICAPGQDVYSTVTQNKYRCMDGTSMAAPIVAGALAYCWSLNLNTTPSELKNVLLRNASCSAYGVGNGASYTYPMVNVERAVETILGIDNNGSDNSKGRLSGKIANATTKLAVSGAEVVASKTGDSNRSHSNNSGNFAMDLDAGIYKLKISAVGYLGCNIHGVEIKQNETTNLENTILLSEIQGTILAQAGGRVTDAVSGTPIEGAKIKFRNDWGNNAGDYTRNANGTDIIIQTDASGKYYTSDLMYGYYTAEVEKEGYIKQYINIIASNEIEVSMNQDIILTPVGHENAYRITLEWDDNPRDEDAHIVGDYPREFHVFYQNKTATINGITVANLDHDDTHGNGFETIMLEADNLGTYKYYVYHYAGSGNLATSNAKVNVYKGGTHIKEFNVPVDQGNGKYWNVFNIVNGELVTINHISDSAEQ